jgi:hypothetical protein
MVKSKEPKNIYTGKKHSLADDPLKIGSYKTTLVSKRHV